MSWSGLPHRFMDFLSDPLVLLDKKGAIFYANSACQKSFPAKGPDWKNICLQIRHLDIKFRRSGQAFSSEIPLATTAGQQFSVHIFAVGNLEAEGDVNLALLTPPVHTKKPRLSNLEAFLKASLNEQKILSRKLPPEFDSLVGEDEKFRIALFTAQKAAGTDLPVLIIGESGTGKEKLAQAIHNVSRRRKMPFVDINCAAIPDNLIESELFGYEKGAFTGARIKGKRGLFEEAHKGSIFLDEIGDTSSPAQSRLLRVLQEGLFKRVGGTKNVSVDVRVISATNKDLAVMILDKCFRDDLYYRLNTISLLLPPLRDRGNDFKLLANLFLQKHSSRRGDPLSFSEETLDLMNSHSWPGNIRELKSVVDYAATMCESDEIGLESLPKSLVAGGPFSENKIKPPDKLLGLETEDGLLPKIVQQVERSVMEKISKQSKTKTEAIKRLGISRRTFYNKLKRYHLETYFNDH